MNFQKWKLFSGSPGIYLSSILAILYNQMEKGKTHIEHFIFINFKINVFVCGEHPNFQVSQIFIIQLARLIELQNSDFKKPYIKNLCNEVLKKKTYNNRLTKGNNGSR